MSGRIYSGNLGELMWAMDAYRGTGFRAAVMEVRNPMNRNNEWHVKIHEGNTLFIAAVLTGRDDDVLCNNATAWLRKQHKDIRSWK